MIEHKLKTQAVAWDAIERGEKRFEVRRNDRFFQRGDIVVLRRLKDGDTFYLDHRCGEPLELRFRIGWMLQGGQFGLEPGYCVFQLEELIPAGREALAAAEGREDG